MIILPDDILFGISESQKSNPNVLSDDVIQEEKDKRKAILQENVLNDKLPFGKYSRLYFKLFYSVIIKSNNATLTKINELIYKNCKLTIDNYTKSTVETININLDIKGREKKSIKRRIKYYHSIIKTIFKRRIINKAKIPSNNTENSSDISYYRNLAPIIFDPNNKDIKEINAFLYNIFIFQQEDEDNYDYLQALSDIDVDAIDADDDDEEDEGESEGFFSKIRKLYKKIKDIYNKIKRIKKYIQKIKRKIKRFSEKVKNLAKRFNRFFRKVKISFRRFKKKAIDPIWKRCKNLIRKGVRRILQIAKGSLRKLWNKVFRIWKRFIVKQLKKLIQRTIFKIIKRLFKTLLRTLIRALAAALSATGIGAIIGAALVAATIAWEAYDLTQEAIENVNEYQQSLKESSENDNSWVENTEKPVEDIEQKDQEIVKETVKNTDYEVINHKEVITDKDEILKAIDEYENGKFKVFGSFWKLQLHTEEWLKNKINFLQDTLIVAQRKTKEFYYILRREFKKHSHINKTEWLEIAKDELVKDSKRIKSPQVHYSDWKAKKIDEYVTYWLNRGVKINGLQVWWHFGRKLTRPFATHISYFNKNTTNTENENLAKIPKLLEKSNKKLLKSNPELAEYNPANISKDDKKEFISIDTTIAPYLNKENEKIRQMTIKNGLLYLVLIKAAWLKDCAVSG